MDRLTVKNRYDPATGFIVAEEVIALPAVLRDAPPLDEAVERARSAGVPVVVFATADRCAPCQQFKKDVLNDAGVIERLGSARAVATHLEVDRRPDLADRYLGGRAIPMTYLLVDGRVKSTLRGQRSAAEMLEWLIAQGV
jgi:thioredoxin-like negative regulator of GroEL